MKAIAFFFCRPASIACRSNDRRQVRVMGCPSSMRDHTFASVLAADVVLADATAAQPLVYCAGIHARTCREACACRHERMADFKHSLQVVSVRLWVWSAQVSAAVVVNFSLLAVYTCKDGLASLPRREPQMAELQTAAPAPPGRPLARASGLDQSFVHHRLTYGRALYHSVMESVEFDGSVDAVLLRPQQHYEQVAVGGAHSVA